jgi:peptide deformylase
MSVLKIAHYPEPVLLTVGRPVLDQEFDAGLQRLVEDMFETMYEAGGVGLAAPQIFESRRLFVMDVPDEDGKPNKLTFVNPEIVTVEGEQTGEEGCLSIPGLIQTVQRQRRVKVRAREPKGNEFEADLKDLAARCVLHETDHCVVIVFLDRMSALNRQLAKRKFKALQKTGNWE